MSRFIGACIFQCQDFRVNRLSRPAADAAAWCPDLDRWPRSWMGVEKDLPPGEQLLPAFRAFIEHLAASGLSPKTVRHHIDNLWTLGGEIIRDLHYDPSLRVEGLQPELKLIEESYGIETLKLVLARAYLLRLRSNNRVMRYLSQHRADLVVALKTVVRRRGLRFSLLRGSQRILIKTLPDPCAAYSARRTADPDCGRTRSAARLTVASGMTPGESYQ